jgi:hypothetical protein
MIVHEAAGHDSIENAADVRWVNNGNTLIDPESCFIRFLLLGCAIVFRYLSGLSC